MEQFGVLSLGSRLKRLSDHLYNEVQSVYLSESLIISSTYFPILRLLQQCGELSVVEMAERLGLSHPAVSKQVSKMIKETLLIKRSDPHDQRRSVLALSELCAQQMALVEPVLEVIGDELENYLNQVEGSFLEQLGQLEKSLLKAPYSDRVVLRLHPERLRFEPVSEATAPSFKALNLAWLTQFFPDDIYPQDMTTLNDPIGKIQQYGGQAICALYNDKVLGTYIMTPSDVGEMELSKLCVDPAYTGLGIGERLMAHGLDYAEKQGVQQVMLESHTCLTPALGLYRKLGFSVCKQDKPYSVPRANIRLVKTLEANS